MDPRSFNHMMTSGPDWSRVLENLVRRKSELAVHVVRAAAGTVADVWMQGQEPQVPRFTSNILLTKCEDVTSEDQENNTAMLECGHITLIPKRCLRMGREIETANLRCECCHQFVLEEHQREEARAALNAEKKRRWIKKQALWAALDQRDLNDQFEVHITAKTLHCVLGETVSSLDSPSGIVPASQSPFESEETIHAMRVISQWLEADRNCEVRTSIREIRAHLMKIIEKSLRATTISAGVVLVPKPAGWSALLDLWMDRAMKFLQHRVCEQCGGFGNERNGVHFHQKYDIVYTAVQDKDPVDFGAIEEGMVGTKMQ
ncbi:hypothetical protein LTR95_016752 [Oleoguttula sp. CCFEE 5521]